jgi:orotate phosphoribosyltransferase
MRAGPREELRQIIATHSLLYREEGFLLASGKRSQHYFDLKLTTLSNPEALFLASRVLLDKIRTLGVHIDAVGGLTSGADPLVIAVSQLALRDGLVLPAFFVRDEQKTHGTERMIEGTVTDGMNVVILDDVITTGGSVLKAIRPVEKQGARVVQILILVDREEGGLEALRERGYSVEPIFSYGELKS